MADIFISYSKKDHKLARELAAFLEAEGYTVWYDRDLTTGEEFSDEIARELAKSRAAIVIWTENSITSKWVKAEAERANADRKLIPVKQPSITYESIPLPFNILHTKNISDKETILSAIIAQLAKPYNNKPLYYMFYKQFRLQILTWFGILGTTLTLISSIKPLINLAYWTNLLIRNWTYITTEFWSYIFFWFTLRINPLVASYLSATIFVASLSIGSILYRKDLCGSENTQIMKRPERLDSHLVYLMCLLFTIMFIPYIKNNQLITDDCEIVIAVILYSILIYFIVVVSDDIARWIYFKYSETENARFSNIEWVNINIEGVNMLFAESIMKAVNT
jgi:hypothetical protein